MHKHLKLQLIDAFGKAVSRSDTAKCKRLMPERFNYLTVEVIYGKIVPTTEYDCPLFEHFDNKPLRAKLLDPVVKPAESGHEAPVLKPASEE